MRNDFVFKLNDLLGKPLPRMDGKGIIIDKNEMCMVPRPKQFSNEELPKKYIKKLFRKPDQAYCKKCNGTMSRIIYQDKENEIVFGCDGNGKPKNCGMLINLTEFSEKFKLNIRRLERQARKAKELNERPKILVMRHLRLQDKWYIIDNDITYNPVRRMWCERSMEFPATDAVHEKYLAVIKYNIRNAKTL